MSEAKRSAKRVVSNYVRLLISLALGLYQLRLMLQGLGTDAFGLWTLLLSTMGVAEMMREVLRYSLNRELGEAFHHSDAGMFPRRYASAYLLCGVLGAIGAAVFGLFFVFIRVFDVPEELVWPARWLIVARGLYSFVVIFATPTINMLLVAERVGWYNGWLTAERLTAFAAAFVLFELLGMRDPGEGLAAYGVVTAVGMGFVVLATLMVAFRMDSRFVPRFGLATLRSAKRLIVLGGWNALVVLAVNLHLRLGAVLCNLIAGLLGNSVFGLATQLTSYARMATVGMTDGLDAVATRVSSNDGAEERLRRVCSVSTKMHAMVALPAGVAIAVLAGPLLSVWVGAGVSDRATVLPLAELCVRVLVLGITARAISDGWTRLLYGAGYIKRYAWLIVLGGLANPMLTGVLVLLLPQGDDLYAPAAAFTIIFSTAHLLGIPWIGARCLKMPYASMFAPIVRPLIATALAAPTLWAGAWLRLAAGASELVGLVASAGAFGLVYGVLALAFVITPEERRRLVRGTSRSAPRVDDRIESENTDP